MFASFYLKTEHFCHFFIQELKLCQKIEQVIFNIEIDHSDDRKLLQSISMQWNLFNLMQSSLVSIIIELLNRSAGEMSRSVPFIAF